MFINMRGLGAQVFGCSCVKEGKKERCKEMYSFFNQECGACAEEDATLADNGNVTLLGRW